MRRNLGITLYVLHDWKGAIPELREALRIEPGDPTASEYLARAERMAGLDARLSDFQNGSADPADAEEAASLAHVCYGRARYAESVRFY